MSLDLALSYAAAGWPVFTCRPATEEVVDPATGEITTKTEKSPYTVFGLKDATRNERIIRRWWQDNPDAIVGIPTGEKIGAWVLDLDNKPGIGNGLEWLEAMESIHGDLPDTARATTANGGLHIYFAHEHGVRNRGGLGVAVDVRGDGGYCIAAGSVMRDGRTYAWLDHDGDGLPHVAPAPQWLLDLVLPRPYEPAGDFTGRLVSASENPAYVDAALNDELHRLTTTRQGNRGYELNKTAFVIGTFVGAGAVSRADAEAQLYAAAVSNGLVKTDGEKQCRDKIRRGLDSGERQPRQVPAPGVVEHRDISGMLQRAKERREAAAVPQQSAAPTEPAPSATDEAPPTHTEPPRILTATPFIYRDPSLIPRREFLYGRHYVRKYLTATFGAGGGGKSANAVTEALAMCTGRPLLGGKLEEPLRVWYINAEDDPVEIERRFAGAIKHYGIRPEQIEGRLFADSGRLQDFVIMREDGKRTRVCEPVVEAFKDELKRNRIDVAIIDPFVSTHEVEENDNSKIQRVATQWVLIAEKTGTAIELIHHVTKNNMEITADSGRGAGALKDKCRSVRTINQMTESEAEAAAIPQHDRLGYFRVDFGKANLAKRSGKSEWRRFESVKLGNGKGNLAAINGDEIGVVVPWEWPTAEKIVEEGFTPEQIELIRVRIANEDYKYDQKGSPWAGEAVAYALELDMDGTNWKKHAKKMLDALIKERILEVATDKDPVSRKVKKYVRASDLTATDELH